MNATMNRKAIAKNTIEILEAGYYTSPSGKSINIQQDVATCLAGTTYYEPDTLTAMKSEVMIQNPPYEHTDFEVVRETTLEGTKRLSDTGQFTKIGVLNFASATEMGGGFLRGAQAQEETLARSSALFQSLSRVPEYYTFHLIDGSLLYTDRTIYSPHCLVWKDDEGNLLEEPYCVDFITNAAPYRIGIAKYQPQDLVKVPQAIYTRGAKVLSVAAYNRCDVLVLGAWGCGACGNEPSLVAQMFADLLLPPNGQFYGRFRRVIFSIYCSSKSDEDNLMEFQKRFCN